jgi:ABC-type nitrate/sulfonate/bicarbonate transport system, permease component
MAKPRKPLTRDADTRRRVLRLRLFIIAILLLAWQLLAQSGLFYQDVVLGLPDIAVGLYQLLLDPDFYRNLWVTLAEVIGASLIGTVAGLACGMLLGASRILERAFERYLYYLGPTPKIIFFPLMILWFGVGPGSKVALGALSCFFPVALAVAAGMRDIPFILKCVGVSLRATTLQKVLKIYLPAMRGPVINGLRMGFGVAVIGVLLAETKLSNRGLGYLVIQNYQHFDMQAMYALLIAIFGLAVLANSALSHWAAPDRR